MALVLFKSCLSQGIISIRKNILRIAQKIWRSHENRVTRMRCQNGLKDQNFQNIILLVAGRENITLKSVIIYESRLFRPT